MALYEVIPLPVPPGIELKRKRAREHLSRLKNEVRKRVEVLNRDGVVRQIDPETGEHVWMLNAPGSVTDRTAVLAGDFVHNLRSLLDHIVFALDPKPNRRPLPEWPIYQNEGPGDDGFYPAGIMKIWSLPPEAKVIIEGLQPYHGGNSPLLDLQRLDNIDKHRRLLTTPYGIQSNAIVGPAINMRKLAAGEPLVLFAVQGMSMSTGRFKHGDVIARASPTNAMKDVEQMQVRPRFQIALDEPGVSGEIVGELTKMYEFVEQVVLPKFKRLF